MKLAAPGGPHLTYCTNVHPGEAWGEVRAVLERDVAAVKARVAPDRPFGLGLRLSARAAAELAGPGALDELRTLLAERGLYVFTLNGFPYGAFHGPRVKEAVYRPDWLEEARLEYADRLAWLLAALLPAEPGLEGSVSTVPGAFRARAGSEADLAAMADRLLRHAATLHRIREATGRTIVLALEPEPCCALETVADAVGFFERWLFAAGAVARLAALTGLSRAASEAALRRHLGVCLDACHLAVEFEEPAAALAAFEAAGIRVAKVQLSAGLAATLSARDRGLVEALAALAGGPYLHQVVERRPEGLVRYADLPEALAALAADPTGARREWRIHLHVPLFGEALGPFRSTQGWLRELLARLRQRPASAHLEVETYTWTVLPAEYRAESLAAALARELEWVQRALAP
ncbi:MAG TPA: metabolite traffic protein EboE [Thermodesulfobacteriota bacterium]|nr:metabolite traffic protein EboE [Thermodesulfobacteriota bacterium]